MKKTVYFGFFAVIFLMTILVFIWLGQIKGSNEKVLDLIKQYDQKIDYAHTMHDTIRLRQNLLLSMLVTDDLFELDTKIQKFYNIAAEYRQARQALHNLPMSDEEKKIHLLLDQQALKSQPVNDKAANMFDDGEAKTEIIKVINEAKKYQSELLQTLTKFVELQKSQDEAALNFSRQQFDDSIYWISLLGVITFIIAMLVSRYVGRCVIANNKALEEAYTRAEDATIQKSEFLATMSHEIRTPLTAIIGFAETTLFKEQTPEQRDNSIQVIIRSGKHLLQIINDILDLSKVEANKLEIDHETFSLFDMLADIEKLVRPAATDKGLNFSVNYIFPLPEKMNNDVLRLKQILINLCNNAIKFTESGYVIINVSCDCDDGGNGIVFEVIDSGIGISDENKKLIFQAYRQADSSTTRKFGGTGLGLSLSKILAEKMNGSLTVSSKPGKGSKFKLSLEPEIPEGTNIVFDKEHLPDIHLQKANIFPKGHLSGHVLLAEDNPDNQQLLLIYLRRMGAEVTIVENGKLAVEAASEKDFHLILMDMRMPIMGGLEAVTLLRKQKYNKPIVALTANAMQEDKDACFKAGCNGFLTKPVDVVKLNETLTEFLDENPEAASKKPVLKSALLEDDSLSSDLIKRFVSSVADNLVEIETLLITEDWQRLQELLHKLRGTGGNFGYPTVSELAEEMELYAKSKNVNQLNKLLRSLKETHEKMVAGF